MTKASIALAEAKEAAQAALIADRELGEARAHG